ncbi:MAG: hypothetical protein HOC23_10990 [Halieaceae bacterium]|nr:hypothetical protein [Halieaceae bacterium]
MLRRIITGVVLFILIGMGLYLVRIELLTLAFNAALEPADMRLLRIKGLQLSSDALAIDQLVLGLGPQETPQSLHRVHLQYSLTDFQPQHLNVARAVLRLPEGSEVVRETRVEARLLLTELAQQLMASPLESVVVGDLQVENLSTPVLGQPLKLEAHWQAQQFSLRALDPDRQLYLQLEQKPSDQLLLIARLSDGDEAIIEFNASLSGQGDKRKLQGAGLVDSGELLSVVAPLMDLPENITAATGNLVFELSGTLDNDLSLLAQQHWTLLLMPQTALNLELVGALDQVALEGVLRLSFPHPLAITARPQKDGQLQLEVQGEGMALYLNESGYELDARGDLSAIQCEYAQRVFCQADLAVELKAPLIRIEGVEPTTLTGLDLRLSSQLTLSQSNLSATLIPGKLLGLESLVQGGIAVNQPVFGLDTAASFEYALQSGQWKLQGDQMQLLLPRVEMPDLNMATRFTLSSLEIGQNVGKPMRGQVHLHTDGINLQQPGSWLPVLAADADITLAQQALNIEALVFSDEQKRLLSFFGTHQLHSASGSGQLRADPINFDPDANRLSRFFSYWPFELDIYQGKLMLAVDAQWHQGGGGVELKGRMSQQFEGLAGVYEDVGFIGLDAQIEAEFSSPAHFLTTQTASLSLESLDVGVPIESINARFNLNVADQQLSLEKVEAALFGGRLWTQNVVYKADREHNRIDVGVDGMQLEELLRLAGYDAVAGNGIVSGLLPLDISATGVVMERGMLAAKAPGGVFRYSAALDAGTNPAMEQVIDALSNYHYNIFQVEADYRENGDLLLEMLLRGSNPDYEQGRSIHLNLNVTDNIPMLLKSLQSGRVIADRIGKKLGQ